MFHEATRGCKQKYDSAWGTECAGRCAVSYTPAMPHGRLSVYVLTYGVAWYTAVRFAAAAFQRLPKPKPISRIPISLLPSPFNHVFALFPPLSPPLVPFHPYHSTFYSTLFAGENVAAHCLPSLSLCLFLPCCFYLSLFLLIILILFLISIDCY